MLERVMHNRFFRGTALFVRRYFDHRVARDSAALTYYLLFAMFPLLIFLSYLVGFFAVDIEGFLRQLGTIIPAEVLDLLIQYLRYVSRVSSRTLMTFSLIFSIWFPMRAANALLLSVRKAYGMGRPTQFLRHQAKVFLYTICLILTILLSLVLVTVGRSVLNLCADYFHFSAILTDGFMAVPGRLDVIITDPPRAGMHNDVIDVILAAEPKRIVYVSCNPATQARDLQLLDGKYKVTAVQPVDMFPHTHHVENVVQLERR